MGLLNKMFGGGTGIEVQLDATQVPVGGILSGRAIVRGGKKDLELTALHVRLLYVSVQSKDDSPMPDIDTRVLLDNVVVSNQALPAGAEQQYAFQFQIPPGTEPSAHNVSYQVLVAADIPKVADPTAKVELKVIEGAGDADALTGDAIFARWPALRGTAEGPLLDALMDFYGTIWDERDELIGAEPVLASLVRTGTDRVRRQALETWAHLLDGRARKENLQLLAEVAAGDLDQQMTKSLIEAAAKFADEGALPMVQGFVQHPDPEIRKELAQAMHFGGGRRDFLGKRDIVFALAQDPEPEVRAAAFGAVGSYNDDPQVLGMVIQQLDADPSPEVKKACINAIAWADDHNAVLSAFERHLQNPHEEVRKEIGEHLSWFPEEQAQRVYALCQALLSDQSEDVRRQTAWYARNMDRFPSIAPLLQHASQNDPAERVRKDALASLASVMPMEQVVPLYRQWLAAGPNKSVHWAVMDGVRFKDHPLAKELLVEMTQSPYSDVARAAKDALE